MRSSSRRDGKSPRSILTPFFLCYCWKWEYCRSASAGVTEVFRRWTLLSKNGSEKPLTLSVTSSFSPFCWAISTAQANPGLSFQWHTGRNHARLPLGSDSLLLRPNTPLSPCQDPNCLQSTVSSFLLVSCPRQTRGIWFNISLNPPEN